MEHRGDRADLMADVLVWRNSGMGQGGSDSHLFVLSSRHTGVAVAQKIKNRGDWPVSLDNRYAQWCCWE